MTFLALHKSGNILAPNFYTEKEDAIRREIAYVRGDERSYFFLYLLVDKSGSRVNLRYPLEIKVRLHLKIKLGIPKYIVLEIDFWVSIGHAAISHINEFDFVTSSPLQSTSKLFHKSKLPRYPENNWLYVNN